MTRTEILQLLQAHIHINGHIIGVAVGSGITAKYAAMGGADFLLALSAGKYRMMGRSSLAAFLCYDNNNDSVMEMGKRELFPIIHDIPILFGLMATDPQINLYEYLKEIKSAGFAGVVNFPTVAMIDGVFREALEEEGNSFAKEVEAIKLARYLDMFTVAFVTNVEEADLMCEAGADVICVHFGFTKGGYLGARKFFSLEEARRIANEIFDVCEAKKKDTICMIYGGPANTPIDLAYFYHNTSCRGYIGGSSFDRIPMERAILNTTKAFKSYGNFDPKDPMLRVVDRNWKPGDYVAFVRKHIEDHYPDEILLSDLALVAHVSPSYLSTRFKSETGYSFTEYLVRFRMSKAKELFKNSNAICREVGLAVGYSDYAQFSRMFKKYIGYSPVEYRDMVRKS